MSVLNNSIIVWWYYNTPKYPSCNLMVSKLINCWLINTSLNRAHPSMFSGWLPKFSENRLLKNLGTPVTNIFN